MHINDLFLEPLKKIAFKMGFSKREKWFNGNNTLQTPGIDPVSAFTEKINGPSPLMIARFGSTELTCLMAYIISNSKTPYTKKSLDFILGEIPAFWFGRKNRYEICSNSGFFPDDKKLIIQFCERMLDDIKQLDILLTWLNGEKIFYPYLPQTCQFISLWAVEPFFQDVPWTMSLEGKKVLIIHPFAKTIEKQYLNRHSIFPIKQILPNMQLSTFKAVQTIANNKAPYGNWFDALNYMANEIEKLDFEIALIGAGAYGLPLAAEIKRSGKKAIHIGGSLQLYFGIIGLRWEQMPHFKAIMNEHWIRPSPEEYPDQYTKVEGGVYW